MVVPLIMKLHGDNVTRIFTVSISFLQLLLKRSATNIYNPSYQKPLCTVGNFSV